MSSGRTFHSLAALALIPSVVINSLVLSICILRSWSIVILSISLLGILMLTNFQACTKVVSMICSITVIQPVIFISSVISVLLGSPVAHLAVAFISLWTLLMWAGAPPPQIGIA